MALPFGSVSIHRKLGTWLPEHSIITATGMRSAATTGTATARVPASTNLLTSLRRIGAVSAAGAGSIGAFSPASTILQFWRGNAAGLGGFNALFRFAVSDAALVATANMFVGFKTSLPTDNPPSGFTNLIGVGCDNGDTTLQLYAAGGAAQARTNLGANFPVNTTDVDVYELGLFALPNGSEVRYHVRRLNVPAQAPVVGSIPGGARLPASTTFFGPYFSRSNGGTAAAVGIDMIGCYIETDL